MVEKTKRLRSYFVKGLLVSLVAAGAMGIWVLLASTFGEVEGKVLLTTLLVGIYSLLSLCSLTLAGKRYEWVGLLGVIVTSVALVAGLLTVWMLGDLFSNPTLFEILLKTFYIFGVTGFSIAHASLLLLLSDKPDSTVQSLLMLTIGALGLVAALLVLPVLNNFQHLPEGYWRILGVLAILDVVGTVATPAIAKFRVK
jgi:hypothetical protein